MRLRERRKKVLPLHLLQPVSKSFSNLLRNPYKIKSSCNLYHKKIALNRHIFSSSLLDNYALWMTHFQVKMILMYIFYCIYMLKV